MKVNIFEGARRAALFGGALWVCFCIAVGVLDDTAYVQQTYAISHFGSAPVRVAECYIDEHKEYLRREDAAGNTVHITLCFRASKADNGQHLIPYAQAGGGKFWMAAANSLEVARYAQSVGSRFELDGTGRKEADSQRQQARWAHWKQVVQFGGGGLLIGWIAVALIGWVARGFLGIPKGRDTRPEG